MKELSIEEKAKRYDEAIKRVENINTGKCKTTFMFTAGLFEYVFPELAGSEDERIRNFLIDFIKVCGWTEKKDQGWPLREECIAWLEKQGEKKLLNNEQYQTIPVETLDRLYAAEKELAQLKQKVEPKFKIGDTVWLKTNTHEYTKTIEDMDDECYIFNDGRILTFNCQDDWELVEQKPAFEMKTPEESLGIDSDTYNKIVDDCVYGEQKPTDADLKDIVDKEANSIWKEINTGGSHSVIDSFNQFYGICMQVAEAVVDCKKPAEWIQELESKLSNATPEQLAEWKEKYFKVEPAWSVEDERTYKSVLYAFEHNYPLNSEQQKFIKSLKGRVQPKQEWSEKDEVALDDALWCCRQAASIAKDENDMGNVWYAENWLKSIKDRVLPQPKQEWKPSDEQMNALDSTLQYSQVSYNSFEYLNSLYNDLKKLREE